MSNQIQLRLNPASGMKHCHRLLLWRKREAPWKVTLPATGRIRLCTAIVSLASQAITWSRSSVNWRSWYNAWDLLLMWHREAMKVVSFDTPKGCRKCRIWCVRQSIDIGCNKFKPLTTILSILAIMREPRSGKHNRNFTSYNNYMHESSWAVYWQKYGGRERDSENGGDSKFRQSFGVWKITTFMGSRYHISNRFKAKPSCHSQAQE